MIAERALSEMLTTFGAGEPCSRISSASVVDIRYFALLPMLADRNAVGDQLRVVVVRAG